MTFGYKPGHTGYQGCFVHDPTGREGRYRGRYRGRENQPDRAYSAAITKSRQGAIRINGVDIREVAQKDLRQHLALVLQDPLLFKGRLPITFASATRPLPRSRSARRPVTLARTALSSSYRAGTNTSLKNAVRIFRLGQRQLLSFARALAYNPQAILILDEATSSVDSESEAIIQEALKKLLENRTALIIAHRLSTIKDVDRVIVMDKGKVVEMGGQDELLARRGWYYQFTATRWTWRPIKCLNNKGALNVNRHYNRPGYC